MSTFKVLDMSCGHCEKAIVKEFQKNYPEAQIDVNLKEKIVEVLNLSDDKAMELLKEIGHTPEKVE